MGSRLYVVADDIDDFTHGDPITYKSHDTFTHDDPIKYKGNHDTLTVAVTKITMECYHGSQRLQISQPYP